ncbi:MAG: hypothetical protein ACXAEN_24500 [Candidatus Thorarchaeota archaeon]|jgi:hypothetical protein
MSEKPKTLEEMILVFERTISDDISERDRKILGEAYFNGMMTGVGVISNRMAEVRPPTDSVNDYLMLLSGEISKFVSDIVKAELKFKGTDFGEG